MKLNHCEELKVRSLYVFIMLIATFYTCYTYKESIIYILIKPLLNLSTLKIKQYFIFTNLLEIFFMYLKIIFAISLYLIIPFILYQIWLFFIPGLYVYEKIYLKYFFSLLVVMLYVGLFIAYYLIIPSAWEFFISFETKSDQNLFSIQLEAKINEYLIMILKILLTTSFYFQFPLYILMLVDFKIISIDWFYKKRKVAYILALIIAALISPPDLLSQILIVIPVIILYEFSIFYILLIQEYQKV